MPRLQQLSARAGKVAPRASVAAAGDTRIRGSALQTIRERILRRDKGVCRCARCEHVEFPPRATIVDHRVPLWAGGREDDSNRQAISQECHAEKSRHEDACRARGHFEPWAG